MDQWAVYVILQTSGKVLVAVDNEGTVRLELDREDRR